MNTTETQDLIIGLKMEQYQDKKKIGIEREISETDVDLFQKKKKKFEDIKDRLSE